jgi:hypothetical protein
MSLCSTNYKKHNYVSALVLNLGDVHARGFVRISRVIEFLGTNYIQTDKIKEQ